MFMARSAIPDARQITRLHAEAVKHWHLDPVDRSDAGQFQFPSDAFLSLVCHQHESNFRLWHEEDKARSRTATDREIAAVKRTIDKLNQQRNDRIEQLDDTIAGLLNDAGVRALDDAPLNTETPGSAIDRLSIMSLRIYHYGEQLGGKDADDEHQRRVRQRLSRCRQQWSDLSESLQQLLDDIFTGVKRHHTYRQMKMYNDPSLNPHLKDDV